MAVILSNTASTDLKIKLVEDKGRVELVYGGFSFVRCFTNDKGEHLVEIHDIDTGVRASHNIAPLCWQR